MDCRVLGEHILKHHNAESAVFPDDEAQPVDVKKLDINVWEQNRTSQATQGESEKKQKRIIWRNELGNEVLGISYEPTHALSKLLHAPKDGSPALSDAVFGCRYEFQLFDHATKAASASAVDAPEWMVPQGKWYVCVVYNSI